MLSDQTVFDAGALLGLIISGQIEPSIDLDKANEDGFITLNLRDKRDGTTLVLKVMEINLERPGNNELPEKHTMVECINCHNMIRESDRFCPYCGRPALD